MNLIIRWLINTLVLLLAAYLIPQISLASFYAALMTALFLGIINALIRPIIIILTLPINILTLGLFTLVINALLILFVASFVQGFAVAGFLPAVLLSIIIWLGSWITSTLLTDKSNK